MTSSSRFFFTTSVALAFCAATCTAQSTTQDTPAPEVRRAAIIEQDQPDTHEDQATTRSVSQIRIVRLSQVRGQVQLDRKTGQKFEAAFTNLPIVAGEQLRTQQGVAEVEFEDNSSLRLITDSQVEFPQLGRDISGTTTTTVNLLRGSIYVSLANSKTTGEFTIRAGHQALTLAPSSHLRLDIDQTTAKLTVFQGTVTAASDAGSIVVGKRKAVTFDLASTAAPVFARLDEPAAFDEWDKNAVDYHKARAVAAGYANSPYSYGVNDLSYYGAFSNVGGCGTMWRPYLATASFDPYGSGVWSYYPGSGYSWVSPYPWGWTPYHSGSWSYCAGGGGWGWQPEGGWNGLQNQPAAANRIKLPGTAPIHAPLPPAKGQPTIIGVNLNKLQTSKPGGNGESFVFQGGSAGIGVPRGVFGNLGKQSQRANERGFATTSISETQAARSMIQSPTASVNASGRTPGSVASFNRAGGNAATGNRSVAANSSMNSSAASSRSFSTASSAASMSHSAAAPASAPAGGGAHH